MKKFFLGLITLLGMFAECQTVEGSSWVSDLPFYEVPFRQGSGKVVGVSKNPNNSFEMYMAFENSGVWYSQNNGASFVPISGDEMSLETEALGVDWKGRVVWASGRNGVFYKSFDSEKWQRASLSNLKNVTGFLFPSENEVGISVMGTDNSQKGYFYSSDKGKSWKQTFNRAGVIDAKVAPDNNRVIYMAVWDKSETPYEITPYGKKSGLYKSVDGGATWDVAAKKGTTFPQVNVGRMSVAVYNTNVVYVLLDNRNKLYKEGVDDTGFEEMSDSDFLSLDDNKINEFIYKRGLENLYSADNLKEMVRSRAVKAQDIKSFLKISNEVIGAEVFKTKDGGASWGKTHTAVLENVFYGKGYEVCQLGVNPKNENELYLVGVPMLKSSDGGKSWELIRELDMDVKVDNFYVDSRQLVTLSNKGMYQSFDSGRNWEKQEVPQAAQVMNLCYASETGNIYASVENSGIYKLQNGNWVLASRESGRLAVDTNGKIYVGKAFGEVYNSNNGNYSTPPYNKDRKTRFGEETPVFVSPQNNSILYTGGNVLYQSLNGGRGWVPMSTDLTNGGKGGNKSHGNITQITESPFQFGLLYVGTDDGMIQGSTNGGVSWQMVYSSFPQHNEVVSLVASRHEKERVYAVLKSENNTPLVFRSDDYARTWNNLRANLPEENVLTIAEDAQNEQVLYVGTESGLYVSFNRGESWHKFVKGLPKIAVSHIVIDDKNKTLYAGTLNRGVFKADISALKELKAAVQDQIFYPLWDEYAYDYSPKWGNASRAWEKPEKPEMYFIAFASTAGNKITIKIQKEGVALKTIEYVTKEGFNYVPYDLTVDDNGRVEYEKKKLKVYFKKASDGNYYIIKGNYQVSFEGDAVEEERSLRIK